MLVSYLPSRAMKELREKKEWNRKERLAGVMSFASFENGANMFSLMHFSCMSLPYHYQMMFSLAA